MTPLLIIGVVLVLGLSAGLVLFALLCYGVGAIDNGHDSRD